MKTVSEMADKLRFSVESPTAFDPAAEVELGLERESHVPVLAVVTDPTDGTVVLELDGSFTYTPNPGFVGTETFTYLQIIKESYL